MGTPLAPYKKNVCRWVYYLIRRMSLLFGVDGCKKFSRKSDISVSRFRQREDELCTEKRKAESQEKVLLCPGARKKKISPKLCLVQFRIFPENY